LNKQLRDTTKRLTDEKEAQRTRHTEELNSETQRLTDEKEAQR